MSVHVMSPPKHNPDQRGGDHAQDPTIAGRLDSSPMPELLAYAFNEQFQGSVVLQSARQARSGILFAGGHVVRARAAGMDQSLARQVLEGNGLTEADLIQASRFAQQASSDVFTAVERLGLLNAETLESARAAFVERQVRALGSLPADTVFGFFPELDTLKRSPGPAQPLVSFDLIVACLLEEPSLDRCRDQLEPIKNERLKPVGTVGVKPGSSVARVRPVIDRIKRAPHSLEELRLLNLVPERDLVACVYALRLTRLVAREGSASGRPSWPSRVPRRNSSQAFRLDPNEVVARTGTRPHRETLPDLGIPGAELDSVPPGRSSFPPSARQRQWQEQNAESKALEAWALAEGGDPVQIKKALAIVEKAVEFFPNNPQIRFYAGCLYRLVRQHDAAARAFRRVLTLDPDNSEAQRELDLLGKRSVPPASKGVFGRLRRKP
jgi:tetratricopeptide (TPR) repeat protein